MQASSPNNELRPQSALAPSAAQQRKIRSPDANGRTNRVTSANSSPTLTAKLSATDSEQDEDEFQRVVVIVDKGDDTTFARGHSGDSSRQASTSASANSPTSEPPTSISTIRVSNAATVGMGTSIHEQTVVEEEEDDDGDSDDDMDISLDEYDKVEDADLERGVRERVVREEEASFLSSAEFSSGALSYVEDEDEQSSASRSTRTAADDDKETKRLVRKESKAVHWGRVAVFCSIILLGALLAFTVFRLGQNDSSPRYAAIAVGVTFFVALIIFVLYDHAVSRLHRKTIARAHEARAIVSSLFPANVRDRLFESNRDKRKEKKKESAHKKRKTKKQADENAPIEIASGSAGAHGDGYESPTSHSAAHPNAILSPDTVQKIIDGLNEAPLSGNRDGVCALKASNRKGGVSHPKHRLKTFLNTAPPPLLEFSEHGAQYGMLDKPIADLFPHTTVLFADIVGFTAWSSEREPTQVFTLLQTLYQSFDRIAKRRGVFKVETIGDCYVAVTGLPDPQPDHAVRMTKFAREIVSKTEEVTKNLEVSLGPDTGDLCLRLGMNSGPVTAGVLQGEKSRFQLFGDTVNTASRMESIGEPDSIQVSSSTADLLKGAGKAYWVKAREDLVHAKGKGKIQTYWVVSKGGHGHGVEANRISGRSDRAGDANTKSRPGMFRGMSTRVTPLDTRSTLTCEPTRGVLRTTSDSVAKISTAAKVASSQSNELAERREDRLVQWQVEIFAGLLKRIVAARTQRTISRDDSSVEVTSYNDEDRTELHDVVVPLNDEDKKLVTDLPNRFSSSCKTAPVAGTTARMERESSIKGPVAPRRKSSLSSTMHSFSSEISVDAVSLLGQSCGELTFGQSFVTNTSDPDLGWSKTTLSAGHSLGGKIVVDEVAEVIALPKFKPELTQAMNNVDDVELPFDVVSQLKDYIGTIAHMYRKNPFHNFEHAAHVTMSANKLLNRIVIPESVNYDRDDAAAIAEDLFDYTYGITSDPLTQFAVVFSALVHDVDHSGVSNMQLAKENPELATTYRNKSIAEQNSVDLAWDLFLDPMYKDLQNCIASDHREQKRFRQLVVNSVMATDIFDKDMKELRNKRWDKAFHRDAALRQQNTTNFSLDDDRNMKATIVIEHIIQASDVAHTMQHWHIYTKWNERLFEEMYSAYECGRSENNPAEFWYNGELWFFDNYVIPLAKKLEECNVFGVTSDECLNYACANRNEWQMKGQEVVLEMVARYHKKKFLVCGIAKKPRKQEVARQVSREA